MEHVQPFLQNNITVVQMDFLMQTVTDKNSHSPLLFKFDTVISDNGINPLPLKWLSASSMPTKKKKKIYNMK